MTFLSAFSTPDSEMQTIMPDEFERQFNDLCAYSQRCRAQANYLWYASDGTTFVHRLTDEETAYLLSHEFRLYDLRGLVDFNWLEMPLPMPFHRIEVHLLPNNEGFEANVYEYSESATAIWTGTMHNVSNIKERRGKDLVQLCKDVVAEVIPWYHKWADNCKESLSEPEENNNEQT